MGKRALHVLLFAGLSILSLLALPACQSMRSNNLNPSAGRLPQGDGTRRKQSHSQGPAWDRFVSERDRLVMAP